MQFKAPTRASSFSRAASLQRFLYDHPLLVIGLVWFLSSLIAGPVGPRSASPDWHWKAGPIYLGRPIATSGDSPHYLVIVNSLIEDFDLDLANNHRQCRQGDWDGGTRVRWTSFGGHGETDGQGRTLSFHPFFRPLLLSLFVWPWRGSEWVESLCIWLTMAGALLGLAFFQRHSAPDRSKWTLLLALATPLWFYSSDLWSEAWLATAWILLVTSRSPALRALASFLGCLIKYAFAVVPLTMAAVAMWKRDWARAFFLGGPAILACLVGILATRWVFADAIHSGLFHLGERHLTGAPGFSLSLFGFLRGGLGLLFDPRSGLLPFAPFLAWGFWQFRKDGDLYLPALAFFALHASYAGWDGGAGYSARFLVPALPVLVRAVADTDPRSIVFQLAVVYSVCCAALAGALPIAAFDRAPWEIVAFLYQELSNYLSLG